MAAELRQFIQEEHAVVRQRHLARHRHVAAADQSRIRDGMVGRATRAGGDQGRAVAGEARDAVLASPMRSGDPPLAKVVRPGPHPSVRWPRSWSSGEDLVERRLQLVVLHGFG